MAAVKDRSTGLTSRQRSACIMFDGKRDSSEVLKMTAGVGVTQSDVDHLVSLGLLADPSPNAEQASEFEPSISADPHVVAVSSVKASGMPALSAQADYSMASRLSRG